MEIHAINTGSAGAKNSINPIAPLPARKARVTSAEDSSRESLTPEQVKEMAQQIEQRLNSVNVKLDFTPYGEQGEKMAVIVTNIETGQVIREIPSKELRDLYMKMNELIGILFNRQI